MNKYIIGPFFDKTNIAGGKFPNDIITIFKSEGYTYLSANEDYNFKRDRKRAFIKLKNDLLGWFSIPKGSLVVYIDQVVPRRNRDFLFKILTRKKCKVVSLLEDVEILRRAFTNQEASKAVGQLNSCKAIISQNAKMTERIKKLGVTVPIYELGVLDFLADLPKENKIKNKSNNDWTICYGGNLSYIQSGFIYELPIEQGIRYNIYGTQLPKDKKLPTNVTYKGVFDAEDCIGNLDGDWGLVWNGQSLEIKATDLRSTYYNYVSPHKFSMYILCGMPVIVSDQSAMAGFVKENNCGVVIRSIEELSHILHDISEEQFTEYCRNTRKLAEKISKGFYTKSVIKRLEKDC